MMSLRARKAVVGLTILSVTGGAVGAGCPAVVDSVWQAAMTAASGTVSAGVTGLVEAVSAARVVNLARIQSAIRVTAKQVEVSGEKLAMTEIAAKQGSANYAVELANRRAILETAMEYNAATGQGFDPCGEQRRAQNIAVAVGEANTGLPDRIMREVDAAPGRLVPNQAEVVARRLADQRSLYGANGPQAGRDLDAGHFFTTYQMGTPEAQAKSALLNHMYGIPYAAPERAALNSPAGRQFIESKRAEDAYRSISQTSLKTLQAWTESRPGGGDGSASVLGAISAKVGTYSGGGNYAEWEMKKTSESEHGLLVELAKMRAFELYMRNLEYQQLERQEANLAALLALRARSPRDADGVVSSERAVARSKVD